MSQRPVVGIVLLAGLAACAGPPASSKKSINQMLASQDYARAEAYVASQKDSGYGAENSVLYDLDLGLILHYDGQYKKSNEHLAAAEDRMADLYTKSISRGTGALLANESIAEYAGEGFEQALSHAFHALNYVFLGQTDEALVEARRGEAFLDEVKRTAGAAQSFRDDAFVRYLSALLYEDAGKNDDARVSFEAAAKAYAHYASQYGVPAPSFEFPTQFGEDGELLLLHYNGPAPLKIAKENIAASGQPKAPAQAGDPPAGIKRWADALGYTQVAKVVTGVTGQVANAGGAILGTILNVSFPEYEPASFGISNAAVQTDSGKASTQLVEDVYAVASQDLAEHVAALKARSVARATLKLAAQAVTHVDSSGSEFADVRSCSVLPSQIRMARLKLKPGTYQVRAHFTDAAGKTVADRVFGGVVVRAGKRTWLQVKTVQ